MISGNEQFERDFEAFIKEDDSRLAALYRKLPRLEPDAKLDAAVLAMAHRTLNPHLVATPLASAAGRRRAHWLAPLGAAAGLVLAAGVALRVGPQIWGEHSAPASAVMRDNGVIQVRPVDEAAPALPPPASPPPPPAETTLGAPTSSMSIQAARAMKPKAAPIPAREAAAEEAQQPAAAATPVISADRADVDAKELKKVENAAPRVAAPQAFPGQARREPEMDSVERKQAIASGAWQKLHENEVAGAAAGGTASQNAPVTRQAPAPAASALDAAATPTAVPRAKSAAAPANATTTMTPTDSAAAPAEQEKRSELQQPRYSADLIRNSRLYPESWVAAIQRLIRAGHRDEAKQNLELFRKKYPNYRLPADIQRFLATQK